MVQVAADTSAVAKSATAKPAAGKKGTDLDLVLKKVARAQKELSAAGRFVGAWLTALIEAKKDDDAKGIKVLHAALEKGSLKEAHALLEARREARWTPPKVKVSVNGGFEMAVGAPVTFRQYHLNWGVERGVFTKEEAATLVVVRVTKGPKGSYVTVKSEKTGNHFGPYEGGSKLIAR